jgi:hypothetical protein
MSYTSVKSLDGQRVKAPEEADPAARFSQNEAILGVQVAPFQ